MSTTRNFLTPYTIINAGDMSAATVTSLVTNIKNYDDVSIYLSWTGTPVGTFAIYGNHSNDTTNGVPLTLTPSPTAAGSAGSILIDMKLLSFPYIYVIYTKGSSTGVLTGTIAGKGW